MILFWIIVGIDGLIFLVDNVKSIILFIKTKFYSKVVDSVQASFEKAEGTIPTDKSEKAAHGVLSWFFLVVSIVVITSIIWVPTVLFFKYGWRTMLISLMLFLTLLSLIIILIHNLIVPENIPKEGAIIKQTLYITFYILVSIAILFDPLFPLSNTINKIYTQSSSFSLTIFISIMIIGLLVTNVYLYVKGLIHLYYKNKNQLKAQIKRIDILIIFTAVSFISLFYIVDREWIFLNSGNSVRFYENIGLFKIGLGSVLAPSILSRLKDKPCNNTNEELDLSLDEVNKIEEEIEG